MIIWVIWIKYLIPIHPLSNIEVTKYFNYKPKKKIVLIPEIIYREQNMEYML